MTTATRQTDGWPAVNGLVEMAGPAWAGWLKSRIDEIEPPHLVVAAPTGRYGELIMPPAGDHVLVHWPADRGVGELHARIAVTTRGHLATWTLLGDGRPEIVQRRRFVRAGVTVPVTLVRADHQDRVSTIDLSEGGVALACPAAVVPPEVDEEVMLGLDLGDKVIDVQARVLRVAELETGAHTLAVAFVDLPAASADRVRRFVFAELARERAGAWT